MSKHRLNEMASVWGLSGPEEEVVKELALRLGVPEPPEASDEFISLLWDAYLSKGFGEE